MRADLKSLRDRCSSAINGCHCMGHLIIAISRVFMGWVGCVCAGSVTEVPCVGLEAHLPGIGGVIIKLNGIILGWISRIVIEIGCRRWSCFHEELARASATVQSADLDVIGLALYHMNSRLVGELTATQLSKVIKICTAVDCREGTEVVTWHTCRDRS